MHNRTSKETEKAKNFKGSLKKIIDYIKQFKIAIFIVIIFSILSTIFSLLGQNI